MSGLPHGPDRSPLRVLHILRHPMGGLFRHVCDLVEGQQEAGVMTGVLCAEPPPGNTVSRAMLEKLERHCGLGLHIVPMGRLPGIGDFRALEQIGDIARRLRPDILHGHGAKGGAYARLLSRRHSALRLYTPHGGALHYSGLSPTGAVFLAMERLLKSRTDGFIFESSFSQRAYDEKVGRPSAASIVIPNGVRPDEFVSVEADKGAADFVFIGELRRLKGVSVLIDALSGMKARASLAIVGSGPDEAEFRTQTNRLSPPADVTFLGPMTAREAFRRGRVVVMPSLAESLPYVALEAIAAGKPFIATDVGAMSEVFGPDAGALLPPGDVAALRRALEEACEDGKTLCEQAVRLQARVRSDFSTQRMVGDVLSFYERLVASHAQSRKKAAGGHAVPEASLRN